jgi:hypothetical protein
MPDYDYQSDPRTFSQVIEDIGLKDDPKLYLGELVNAFGERGFGALMVFLGLINALPLPPGSTTVLGAPLLLLSMQLLFRRDQLWLPGWALKGSLDRATYRSATNRALKPIRYIERLSRPRLGMMTSELSEVLIGLACTILAVILVLPIWGGNMVPALIIATFGFGLMQKDGILIAIGLFTRFAALQLAFQFFVISYIWYNEPEPLTGMYFQQLYFFCYLLTMVAGGGRFSLDALISRKWHFALPRMTPKIVTASLCLLLVGQTTKAQDAAILKEDIAIIEGKWKGTLTYRDFKSAKDVTMPCNLGLEVKKMAKTLS